MMKVNSPTVVPPGGWRYADAETGARFFANSLQGVLTLITRYYKMNNMPIPADLSERVQDWVCRHAEQPESICSGADARPVNREIRGEFDGSAMWKALHVFALFWRGDKEELANHLTHLHHSIPCGACKRHWKALVKENPFNGSVADELFEWTVNRHNDVNRRIGSPELTVEDARKLYE